MSIILKPSKFLGTGLTNETVKFIYGGEDSENSFKERLDHMPDDWYYKNRPISYSYNSNGHRCKNISEIDLSNYILFTGCSITEGVGLELEKTYPYLISQRLNMDYYNLSLGGTGSDVVFYNLAIWNEKINIKPKFIICQIPYYTRFLRLILDPESITNKIYEEFACEGSWSERDVTKFMMYGEDIYYFKTKMILLYHYLKSLNVPIYFVSVLNFDEEMRSIPWLKEEKCFPLIHLDDARDLIHQGILSHEDLTTRFLNYFHEFKERK